MVFLRMHIETLGDREAVFNRLHALAHRVEQDPADARPLDEIRAILKGRWSFARTTAASVLGELGPLARPAIPDLINALNGEDIFVKGEAAVALGHLAVGDARPVRSLTEHLEVDGADSGYGRTYIEALGEIGSPAVPAIPFLERAAQSHDEHTARIAKESLQKLKAIRDGANPAT